MSDTIHTRSSDPTPVTKARAFPVLEAGNVSYPDGVYSVTVHPQNPGRSIRLTHKVENAPLLQQWIADNAVQFLCATSSPESAYRHYTSSNKPEHLVEWNPDDLGTPPLFTPMLVLKAPIDHVAAARTDGLDDIWNGRRLSLPKAARVAVGFTFGLQAGVQGMLRFRLNADLPRGCFRVQTDTTADLVFVVEMARDLHEYLAQQHVGPTRNNIMTHVVSSALHLLQKEYKPEETTEVQQEDHNLQMLANELADRGLPHWTDPEFKPDETATRMYRHQIPEEDLE